MYELDKEKFGRFVAEVRKENGWTQKELAEKLIISDKAVSKWERGLSMPDVSMLVPLAETLNVTVTELLEGQKISKTEPIDPQQVEHLLQKAIRFSEEELHQRGFTDKKWIGIFVGSIVIILIELLILDWFGYSWGILQRDGLLLHELLCLGFGGYFCLGVKKYLPNYYDENDVHVYSDGFLRMNMIGVRFNNRNWPYIVKTVRISMIGLAVVYPILYMLISSLLDATWDLAKQYIFLAITLITLFVPFMIIARKYE